jgi:nitroreductase
MNIEQAIKQRRSIRRYTPQMPKDGDIKKILEAAIWAPSGLNNQPWRFMVVKDKNKKDDLIKFTKYGRIIKDAPVVICVFLDNSDSYNREKDIMSVGACIQNMLLQAFEFGLGTCWLGEILNRSQEVQKYLGQDDDCELMGVVCLGYSDKQITKGCRKNLKSFLLHQDSPER